MSMHPGLVELSQLHRLPFGSAFTMITAPIVEVLPVTPTPGGTHQLLRIQTPGAVGIDVQLFDQPASVPMSMIGGVLQVSVNPNAKRALVWEASKSARGPQRSGTLVVRKQARVTLFNAQQARTAGIIGYGVVPAVPTEPQAAPFERPLAPAPESGSSRPAPAPTAASGSPIEIARQFAECLKAARQVLGEQANPDDVRMMAKVTFDELRKTAA